MREPAGFLSRHLESVNDVIKILISTETDKKSRLLEVLKPKKEGKLIYGKGINCVTNVNAEKFSDILLTAYHYSPGDKDIPYPQYTAVTALNASFICVAEKVEDLEKLNFLMKLDFTTSKDLKPFTVATYTHHYSQMPDIIKNANRQPELAYLMAWGQDYFNNPALTKNVLYYKGDVKISLENGKTPNFTDCGETSLRNFFWKLSHLSPTALQIFFNNIEKDNPSILVHSLTKILKILV